MYTPFGNRFLSSCQQDISRDPLADVRLSGFLVFQFQTDVRDTVDGVRARGFRLHAEHGRDRRTEQVLIDVCGILRARGKTHHQAHQHRQHAADRAVPQITDLQIANNNLFTYICFSYIMCVYIIYTCLFTLQISLCKKRRLRRRNRR